MTTAPAKQIEDTASQYAAEAIRLDSHGSYGTAISMYQKAISTMLKMVKLYPNYSLNNLYIERTKSYQKRIEDLRSLEKINGDSPIASSSNSNNNSPDDAVRQKLVQSLKATYEELVLVDKPEISMNDIIGLEDSKRILKESIVFPAQRPDLFPLGWPKGILLYGPPGCGKTMLAAAAAAEIDSLFFTVDAASIMSKWLGQAEQNVAKLFNTARDTISKTNSPVIIFIDELDSLLGARKQEVGGEVRARNQFLKEMDGIQEKDRHLPLYIVGATNKPWSLEMPFLRRFQKRVYVPIPSEDSRLDMFEHYTSPLHLANDVDISEIAAKSDGHSGSDIKDICQAVQIRVVSELFESGQANDHESKPRVISAKDFQAVMSLRKPSISLQALKTYSAWTENFKAL